MLKRLHYIIYFLFFVFCLKAQTNLVPNPSFEDTVGCPQGQDEIDKSIGWSSYRYTPNYFNSCDQSNYISVPDNFAGYQFAASGNAYSGFVAYLSHTLVGVNNFREFIGHSLFSPLSIGTKYFV